MTSTVEQVTPDAIVTSGLRKEFGGVAAVDGIDLRVPAGSVFGFLGPNGSGKTTTTRMLLGLMRPTAGTIQVLGQAMPHAVLSVLPKVGALVEGPGFYPFLTGAKNLSRLDAAERGDTRGRSHRVGEALDRVGLSAAADKRFRQYSLGMKQRLAIAAALLRPRELIILDEPTNGLDPQGTREVRELIRELVVDGTTIFLSSHLLAEVELICSHAAVLSHGRIVAQGNLEDLRGSQTATARLVVSDSARACEYLSRLPGVGSVAVVGDLVTVELLGATASECNRNLIEGGIEVHSLSTEQRSLEDIFVALTGEGFDVA